MAKYTITHACGHTATHQIFGTNNKGQRDNKVAWLERTDCADCYKKSQLKIAADKNNALNLPALVGSEKQINWALSIRAEKFEELNLKYNQTFGAICTMDDMDKKEALLIQKSIADKKLITLKNQTAASFWIDARFDGSVILLKRQKETEVTIETKKDKKSVMTRAWVIAKEAQAKFGGKASQYLSGALKAAWAE